METKLLQFFDPVFVQYSCSVRNIDAIAIQDNVYLVREKTDLNQILINRGKVGYPHRTNSQKRACVTTNLSGYTGHSVCRTECEEAEFAQFCLPGQICQSLIFNAPRLGCWDWTRRDDEKVFMSAVRYDPKGHQVEHMQFIEEYGLVQPERFWTMSFACRKCWWVLADRCRHQMFYGRNDVILHDWFVACSTFFSARHRNHELILYRCADVTRSAWNIVQLNGPNFFQL